MRFLYAILPFVAPALVSTAVLTEREDTITVTICSEGGGGGSCMTPSIITQQQCCMFRLSSFFFAQYFYENTGST